jgi:hypothetical protein
MRIKTLVLAGLVLWPWSGVSAFAQEATRLQFVKKHDVGILVESPTEDSRACGITKTSLDAAVRLPLSRNGFFVKSTPSAPYLYINVVSYQNVELRSCVVHLALSFHRDVSLLTDYSDLDRFKIDPSNPLPLPPLITDYTIHGANVWERGMLLMGPRVDMRRRVDDALENYTNQLIAKWLIDNPQ